MSKVLIIDFETTGLDTDKDDIIEVGLILYNGVTKKSELLDTFLVKTEKEIPEEVTKVNDITKDRMNTHGLDQLAACIRIANLSMYADFFCGHNVNHFDKKIMTSFFKRIGIPMPLLHWIDTTTDLPNVNAEFLKLTYLAADHGFLNPQSHSAIFDCLAVMKILQKYDMNEVIKNSLEETIVLKAIVSYDDREIVKKRGFKWDSVAKNWTKKVRMSKVTAEKEALPTISLVPL